MSEVLTIDELRPTDVAPAARLHIEAFPGFFLSRLGEPFLRQFYRGFLTDRSAVTVVARKPDGTILGVAVGTTEPRGFFARLLRRQGLGFAAASLRAVFRHPASLRRLLRAASYRGDPPPRTAAALLSSICVSPVSQGTGVGGAILERWTENVAARGIRDAYLTTDADGNDAVNRFYAAHGWALAGSYRTPEGRAVNRYTKRVGS